MAKITYFHAGLRIRLRSSYFSLIPLFKESQKLLCLDYDWDEEGAERINSATWRSCIRFLLNLARKVRRYHGKPFCQPELSPCHDGSIDIHWEHGDYSLLINLSKEKSVVGWYGYDRVAFHADPAGFKGEETKGKSSCNAVRPQLVAFFSHFV